MKKHLLVFLLALVFSVSHLYSQQMFGFIEPNNIRCSVTSTGDLFHVPGTDIGLFEVPAGSGIETIYAANLWVGGFTPDQQLRMSAEKYQDEEQAWFPGPLTSDGNATTTQEVEDAFNQVWHVTAEQITIHVAYFNALQNGNVEEEFPDGYVIPDVFLNWPAHGNTALGYDLYLAPFVDFNLDMYYDPSQGDYPLFCGDECIYFIINDIGANFNENIGLGIEVHGMLYGFNSIGNDVLNNTVFMKYKMINRSNIQYTNAVMGLWTDFDIGNLTDDFIQTNVHRSAILGYNPGAFDELQDGINYPVQGCMFLAGPRTDDDFTDNPLPDDLYSIETNSYGAFGFGYSDGSFDNERLGLGYSSTYYSSSNPVNGEPFTSGNYYNYMTGKWKNGASVLYGGNFGSIPTLYYAPDVSDPLHLSTGEIDQPLWNETTEGNLAGDRRMVGSTGFFTLQPGEINVLDLAFVYADTEQADDEPLADFFDNRLKEAKLYYNENLVECSSQGVEVGIGTELTRKPEVSIYPNPAQGNVTIQLDFNMGKTMGVIQDISGKTVKTISLNSGLNTISIEDLASGVYVLQIGSVNLKLIKE